MGDVRFSSIIPRATMREACGACTPLEARPVDAMVQSCFLLVAMTWCAWFDDVG
jgi:hypothetical protein